MKGAIGIGISTLALKTDLAGLQTKVDNLDVDKLKTLSAALNKLSNVIDIEIVKTL